jgi:hypothetical protein
LNNIGLKVSTSMSFFFVDQTNQLGLSGSKKLADIFKSLKSLNKSQLQSRIRQLGISSADGIVIGGYGQTIDIKTIPDDMLRVSLARVIWHTTNGSSTSFTSNHTWLDQSARRWTFSSFTRDRPGIKDEIKADIVKNHGPQNWDNILFSGIGIEEKSVIVQAFNKDKKVLFSKSYDITKSPSFHYFTQQKVAFLDCIRRVGTLPQSQTEYNSMKEASVKYFDNVFYNFFGVK